MRLRSGRPLCYGAVHGLWALSLPWRGVLLVAGDKDGVLPLPSWLMHGLNAVINILGRVPFLILMICVSPLSRGHRHLGGYPGDRQLPRWVVAALALWPAW